MLFDIQGSFAAEEMESLRNDSAVNHAGKVSVAYFQIIGRLATLRSQ